jgi:hypothetical protein
MSLWPAARQLDMNADELLLPVIEPGRAAVPPN